LEDFLVLVSCLQAGLDYLVVDGEYGVKKIDVLNLEGQYL